MNATKDTIGSPWWFVNTNYEKRQELNAICYSKATDYGEPATIKDALEIVFWFGVYAGMGCLLAYGLWEVV
ncbi:hypothetical protein NXG27_04195 [Megasphaera paucivorans]|uniref:Uncharacterized protein n=1 Tax=Megasphaera paucivorans TaxID=349095 RepID=A0A1G9QVB5_9FIRM|nr:hypothetical protein [Megasphaera paucivorans]SDM14205.1 hypothetical protein SAMN05660299_00273 [Megasphaera paucivorans]